jgi:RNase P subunit RPR2
MKQLGEPLPPLPAVLSPYQSFLDKLTAKDPAQRFATGADVIQALRQIGEIDVSREDIARGVANQATGATLLRPRHGAELSVPPQPSIATPPSTAESNASKPRSGQRARWLGAAVASVLASVVALGLWRERATNVVPVQDAMEPAAAAIDSTPAIELTETPQRTEAELRAQTAAASRRAAEQREQEEFAKRAAEERIKILLSAAKNEAATGALYEPAGANAVDSYRAILKLQPKHPEALVGMQRVADLLVAEAVQSKAVGDRDSLRRYIDLVQSIQPRHSLLAHLNRELKRLEEKPLVLHKDTQANLEKTSKLVAKANADINRKPPSFNHAESASEYYDEAVELAPFTPGLPLLKERIIGTYSAVVQMELDTNEPKRALRMVNYARERKWWSPDLERLESIAKQRLDPDGAPQKAGGPR